MSSSSKHLRQAGLAALLIIGVLSMHGLATTPDQHDSEPATAAPLATPVDTVNPEQSGDNHGALHAIGQLCLWLVVSGLLVTVGSSVARRLATSALIGRRASPHVATAPEPATRSPDGPATNGVLAC
jgi:uncharacterized protein YjeT (DUF2065 family)